MALVLALWELLRASGSLPRDYVPAVDEIARALVDSLAEGEMLTAIAETLQPTILGLAIAIVVAVPIGVAMGLSRAVEAALRVTVDFLRPVPAVALIPIAILIYGIGLRMQLLLIVFACVWPLLFNVSFGVRNVDPLLIDNARVAGLSRSRIVARVVLPAALPAIFTGIRVAASIALILAVTAELVAGAPGLGRLITSANAGGQIALGYAGIVVAGAMGFMLNLAFTLIDRALIPWSFATRGDRS